MTQVTQTSQTEPQPEEDKVTVQDILREETDRTAQQPVDSEPQQPVTNQQNQDSHLDLSAVDPQGVQDVINEGTCQGIQVEGQGRVAEGKQKGKQHMIVEVIGETEGRIEEVAQDGQAPLAIALSIQTSSKQEGTNESQDRRQSSSSQSSSSKKDNKVLREKKIRKQKQKKRSDSHEKKKAQLAKIHHDNDTKDTTYFKTKMCPMFKNGACNRGNKCNFAHTLNELRELPNYRKTRMCVAFTQGRCSLGIRECKYAHGETDIKRPQGEHASYAREIYDRNREHKNNREREPRERDRDHRDYRDHNRDVRDHRNTREARDVREHRDNRDYRDQREIRDQRDIRDSYREHRDQREYRDGKDYKDHNRDTRDHRDHRDHRDQKDHREHRDQRDSRHNEEFMKKYSYSHAPVPEVYPSNPPLSINPGRLGVNPYLPSYPSSNSYPSSVSMGSYPSMSGEYDRYGAPGGSWTGYGVAPPPSSSAGPGPSGVGFDSGRWYEGSGGVGQSLYPPAYYGVPPASGFPGHFPPLN